ncbi:MAG: ABC transporter ATP-binding protein [Acidobacteriota bacterium]|nr:ABC transporter ATP-binding protein [Acidobacteriota bacterium]
MSDHARSAEGPLYALAGVERRYERGGVQVLAVHDVDLEIRRGEFVSVEGPSGSGKTTLLQLLGALDSPTAGSVSFDGMELGRASDRTLTGIRARHIGFVFQQFNLIPTLTAAENVAMAMMPVDTGGEERHARAVELLEQVGLGARLDHLPSRLSGGEQQRVAVARALANRPSVIVADEPTGNLDTRNANEVMALIGRLQAETDVTVVVATHDPEVARQSRRRVQMRDGAVVDDREA